MDTTNPPQSALQPQLSPQSNQPPSASPSSSANLPSSQTESPLPETPPSISQPPPSTLPKPIILIATVVIAILIGIATFVLFRAKSKQLAQPPNTPSSQPSLSATSSPIPNTTSTLKPVPGMGILGIEVTDPQPNSRITSPVTIRGQANVFEGQVNIRIKDSAGKVLGQGTATACMGETPCPFELSIAFTPPSGKTAAIEAYTLSPKDGSEQDTVSFPVTL